MKKLVVGIVAVLALSACGGEDSKTQAEAVTDTRAAFAITEGEVPDSEVKALLWDVCYALDDFRPVQVVNRLDSPPSLVITIMDNATQAFCPEHREAVVKYLDQAGA